MAEETHKPVTHEDEIAAMRAEIKRLHDQQIIINQNHLGLEMAVCELQREIIKLMNEAVSTVLNSRRADVLVMNEKIKEFADSVYAILGHVEKPEEPVKVN